MAAKRCGAAALDGGHHLHLPEADVARIGAAPGGPEGAEDVRNLQGWTVLRSGRELVRGHVLDHALAQRDDRPPRHGERLSD
jgi:hypothetical protein